MTSLATLTNSGDELVEMMLRPETTKDAFFLLYSRLIELRCETTDLKYEEPASLSFKTLNGETHTLFLENLWIESRANRDEGKETIERYLVPIVAFGEDSLPKRDRIVPLVKDQTYIDILGKETTIPIEHLAADLWIVYAVDKETSIRTISEAEMAQLGVTRSELSELARENLRNILPPVECHGEGPWFLVTAGGDYVASLLLLDSVWDFAAERVEGDVVAVAPTRDVLMFTGAGSEEGLSAIRGRARELEATGDHAVSSTLLRRVGAGWTGFD